VVLHARRTLAFVKTGSCMMRAYLRMAVLTDQATDLQLTSVDLANRASIFKVESLDEALLC
jgi:hypothetical protein